MRSIFYPKVMVNSILDISFGKLKKNNIKGLILDIDNTLVGHGIKEADDRVVKWMENVKNAGIKVCIASNNTEDRVVKFNERLNVMAIHRAEKPRKRAFLKAAQMMGTTPEETGVVGDQIFTDIWGGNRLGMFTILVKPVGKEEPYYIKLKRILERLALVGYKKS